MAQSLADELNWVPKSRALAASFVRAAAYAGAQSHRFVTLEHILLALTEDEEALVVLSASRIDTARLRDDVSAYLGRLNERLRPGEEAGPAVHPDLRRVLEYAATAAQKSRRPSINGAVVVATIVGEGRSVAASLLRALGLTFEDAIRTLQRQPLQPAVDHHPPAGPAQQGGGVSPPGHGGLPGAARPPQAPVIAQPVVQLPAGAHRSGAPAAVLLPARREPGGPQPLANSPFPVPQVQPPPRMAPPPPLQPAPPGDGSAVAVEPLEAEIAAPWPSPHAGDGEGVPSYAQPGPDAAGVDGSGSSRHTDARPALASSPAMESILAQARQRVQSGRGAPAVVQAAAVPRPEPRREAGALAPADPPPAPPPAPMPDPLPDVAVPVQVGDQHELPPELVFAPPQEPDTSIDDLQRGIELHEQASAAQPPPPLPVDLSDPGQLSAQPPPMAQSPGADQLPPWVPGPPPIQGRATHPQLHPHRPVPPRVHPHHPVPPAVHAPAAAAPSLSLGEPVPISAPWPEIAAAGDVGGGYPGGRHAAPEPMPQPMPEPQPHPEPRAETELAGAPYPSHEDILADLDGAHQGGQRTRAVLPPIAIPVDRAARRGADVEHHLPGPYPADAPASARARTQRPSTVEPGQLVETIPRTMRLCVPQTVEVRIAKADVGVRVSDMRGGAPHRHVVQVTRTMSARLKAPDSAFIIEPLSPETQWIEAQAGLMHDEWATWRWTVTPRRRGVGDLQLVVSARTLDPDGMVAETALPDQVFTVKVRTNYRLAARQAAIWVAAMIGGGILGRFGEGLFARGWAAVRQLAGL